MSKVALDKTLFNRYADLKAIVKKADKEIKDLAPKLREQMEAAGKDEVESEAGKYFFSVVPVWTYPPEIQKMEEELEKAKEVAQQIGTATHEDRKDFKFVAAKLPKDE